MMLIRSSARAAAMLASLLVLAAPAGAVGTAEQRSACEGDAFKFCWSDIPNVPKIEACLETNLSHLSSACQAEFNPAADKRTRLQPAHFQ